MNEFEIVKSFFVSKINRNLLKKSREFLFSVFMIVSIAWVSGYVYLLYSDAYAFAKNYLVNNQKIVESLGSIQSMRPGFYNFKIGYASGMWTANFHVVVDGDKKGLVYLQLSNATNMWVVNEARLVIEDERVLALAP